MILVTKTEIQDIQETLIKLADYDKAINNNIDRLVDLKHSMIEMCYRETGIEIQRGDGKSWEDLPYLNATLDTGQMSNAQWVYMRQQQVKWIAPQVMACIMVSLHRKYGFGYDRCARVYSQIDAIRGEYGNDPEKIRDACKKETGINVEDVYTRKREVKAVV